MGMFGRSLVTAALLLSLVAGGPMIGVHGADESTSSLARASPASRDAPSSKSVEAEPVPPSPKVTPREPRVLFITAANNAKCATELARLRRLGGDFEAMKSRGWYIGPGPENHLQIVDRDAIPEIVERLKVHEFPTVACIEKGE